MTAAEKRLDRLMPGLTARERAIIFLRDYKDGVTVNPYEDAVSQAANGEYERLMNIIRFVNGELSDCIMILNGQVTQRELQLGWLQQVCIHRQDLWLVRGYLDACVPHAITEGELRKRSGKKRARGQYAGYDVRPDDDADEVALLRENRKLIEQIVRVSGPLTLPFDQPAARAEVGMVGDQSAVIAYFIRDALSSCWTELGAIDILVGEYAGEFDGEDPLKPKRRDELDDANARIVATKAELIRYVGEWELPDDHEESLAVTRDLAKRVLG